MKANRLKYIKYKKNRKGVFMGFVMIANFGIENGVHTWRINGNKQDLEKLLIALKEENANFFHDPIIENIRNREYSVLLELLIPLEVAGHAKKSDQIPITYGKDT